MLVSTDSIGEEKETSLPSQPERHRNQFSMRKDGESRVYLSRVALEIHMLLKQLGLGSAELINLQSDSQVHNP